MASERNEVQADTEATLVASATGEAISQDNELQVLNDVPQMPSHAIKDLLSIGVGVRNLKVVDSEGWALVQERETEKQKQYAALVWTSRPLEDERLENFAENSNKSALSS